MQVEVNEENIVRYNLVQLTGNTKEELLTAAKEAMNAEPSFVLYCRIPEPADDVLHTNVFESIPGYVPSDEELEAYHKEVNRIVQEEEGKKKPGRDINVVQGEVIETHIEED